MKTADYISTAIPFVHLYDSTETARFWMTLLNVHHLAVVEADIFKGVVDYDSLLKEQFHTVAEAMLLRDFTKEWQVNTEQHVFDALKMMNENRLTIVPITDATGEYVGSIGVRDLLHCFGQLAAVQEPGSILVLEGPPSGYSLKEIASIVESNDARILSFNSFSFPNSPNMYLNLKVSLAEVSPIMLDLERFGYTIVHAFTDSILVRDTKEHYDALMRFLSI